jgi:hypothetical protein
MDSSAQSDQILARHDPVSTASLRQQQNVSRQKLRAANQQVWMEFGASKRLVRGQSAFRDEQIKLIWSRFCSALCVHCPRGGGASQQNHQLYQANEQELTGNTPQSAVLDVEMLQADSRYRITHFRLTNLSKARKFGLRFEELGKFSRKVVY